MTKMPKYGMLFPSKWSALDIELHCFKTGRTVEQGGLGKAEHFWRVVQILWGPQNKVNNKVKIFIRNPWSEKIIDALCEHRYVGVGGCAGSTKSETCALWLLVTYLSDPRNTLGGVLSTSLKEARKRIWGSMVDFVRAIPAPGLPLKVVDSMGIIRYDSPSFRASDKASLFLIAAERKQEKEAVGKLIGMHNENVIIVADELSELTPSVNEYAFPGGNLTSNPRYQYIGLSNPGSYYDPFAMLWKPKDGWTSITVESEEWETELGIGIHFDGVKSPNVLAGKTIYAFLPTKEKIDDAKKAEGGENSIRFWRMIRGFMCPEGQEQLIYAESDIVKFHGDEPASWADQPLIRGAALDPGFTNGGDRSKLKFGNLGLTKDGIKCLGYDKTIELTEDVTNKSEERAYQIARQAIEACIKEGVLPRYFGVDATGAGGPFADILATLWSREIYRCHFGGKASDLPVSLTDPKLGYERYYDRVTEIWYTGRELLRQGQLKGISPEMARQMSARKYGTTGAEKRIYAESKVDMKLRTGFSPDDADAGFILIDLFRQRAGFGAQFSRQEARTHQGNWRNVVRKLGARRNLTVNL